MPRKPVGFGEEQQPELRSGGSAGTPDVTHFKLKVGPGGRVVIPAEVRRGLGVKEGGVRFWDYLGCRLGVPAPVVARLPDLIRAVPS